MLGHVAIYCEFSFFPPLLPNPFFFQKVDWTTRSLSRLPFFCLFHSFLFFLGLRPVFLISHVALTLQSFLHSLVTFKVSASQPDSFLADLLRLSQVSLLPLGVLGFICGALSPVMVAAFPSPLLSALLRVVFKIRRCPIRDGVFHTPFSPFLSF